ncbi:MAG: hypothetical protein IIB37_11960 [Gemmatimonadetes bacterium]|nr:hypothetical protein [Gemmatimonadota bacterium]
MDIRFDVLLKRSPAGDAASIESARRIPAPAGSLERCRRWLIAQGVECHSYGFGLACQAPDDVFGEIFRVESLRTLNPEAIDEALVVPEPITDLVESVTLTRDPELFG